MHSVSAWRSRLLHRDRRSKLNGKTITVQGRLGKLRANINCDYPETHTMDGGNWTEEGVVRVWAMSFTNTKQFPIKTIEQSVRCFKICADVRLYRRAVTHGENCQCALPSQFSIRLAHVLLLSFFLSFLFSCNTRALLCSECKTFCVRVFRVSEKCDHTLWFVVVYETFHPSGTLYLFHLFHRLHSYK